MDYLQYDKMHNPSLYSDVCFKPYYKWITFNILLKSCNGIRPNCFKPYYKWITFNMETSYSEIGTIYTAEF